MVYNWIINGIQPFNIETVDTSSWPKVTLHCASHYTDSRYDTPMDEIRIYEAMSCLSITNTPTQSGGTDVETSMDGTLIPISDGTTTWLGALYPLSYTVDDMSNTLIKFDLVIELAIVNKTIIPDTPTPPDITKPYNLITQGYKNKISTMGVETDLLGQFTFNWDGTGHVYVASDWQADPATDSICIDDELIVTNSEGASFSRSCNAGNVYRCGADIEITSFLTEGDNELAFEIHDIYGGAIGCGPLFVIQTS